MKFKTHNQTDVNICGTSLVGYITCDYSTLKKVFGKPHESDGYKVDAEWDIEFADGVVASIYNYKSGKNYNGRSGTAKTKITNWHIGGFNNKALEYVKKELGLK